MILLVDFQVHCWLLLSKRAHLKESSAKKGTSTENFFFGGMGVDAPSALPTPEGLICRTKIRWDEEITTDLRQNWDKILNTLENIGKISIPRNE